MSNPSRPTSQALATAALAGGVLVLAYAVGIHGTASPARAAVPATPPAGSVGVDATGNVAGTPDVLTLNLGVTSSGNTVSAALDSANRALGAVRDSLRSHGVAPADLQTSGLSVSPNYDYPQGRQRLLGFLASESLTARLHPLSTAGRTITDAVAADGSDVQINGVALDVLDDTGLVAQARDRAFAAARAKAQQYAVLAGRRLDAVTKVTESVTPPAPQSLTMLSSYAAAKGAAPVPVEAGSAPVTVTVTVVWSLR